MVRFRGLFQVHAVDGEPNSGTLLTLQFELHERRPGGEVESVRFYIAASDGDRLHGLIDGVRSDGLNLDLAFVPQQCRYRTCDRVWPRSAGYP